MDELKLVSVVGDDESVREALDGLLRAYGLRVRSFASAEQFLLSDAAPATACLILDLRLTGMTGLTLQHWLVRQGPRVPVIVLSGHGDDQARAQALRAGAGA
jgi:two-component system, LuxR family, response regulator FixJ